MRFLTEEAWQQLAIQCGFEVKAMASALRISLRQLEREFRNRFSRTPTDWLRQVRCRLVLWLVLEGLSNKEIAAELKFSDASHLCHEFKKVYKASPGRMALYVMKRCHLPIARIGREVGISEGRVPSKTSKGKRTLDHRGAFVGVQIRPSVTGI